MQIVHANDRPVEDRQSAARGGTFKTRLVMEGDPDSPGNFSLIFYYQDGTFFSPRHRHSFDQFRYQFEGRADYARNGKLTAGMLGYYPEGAYYGPQSGPPHSMAVLQFGGPSGSGYLAADAHRRATEALKKTGAFVNGVYRRNPGVEGRKNQDAYEAIWEHVQGRKLVYPKPQYPAPIVMDTNHVPWSPVDGVEGVAEQALGTFTNCRIPAARYRIDAGASFVARGRGVYMVLSGGGSVEGEALQDLTCVYLDDGETAAFRADETTIVLLMGLPSVALMGAHPQAAAQSMAAE